MKTSYTFQTTLKRERQRLRLTQANMAKLLQVSVRSYASMERGERNGPRHPILREQMISRLKSQPAP